MHVSTGRSGYRQTLAAVTAVLVACTATVAAASDPTSTQSVTIEVTVEPRELTVSAATVTLADVSYGFDFSDDANPGVSSGRLAAGSSGFIVKAGPDDAQATAELVRLQDVTAADATDVRWSDVFAAKPDGLNFSLRLFTGASCTPAPTAGCSGRTAMANVPAIDAGTTPSNGTVPVGLRRFEDSSGGAAGLVGGANTAEESFAPFGSGVTGTVTVNFMYLGHSMPPVDGGATRTIEIDLRSVLADA